MPEAANACTIPSTTPATPLPAILAQLAIVAARQAAMARPDPAAWAALDPERRAGFNRLAEELAREFLRLRRLALATPPRTIADLRALAGTLARTEPADDPAGILAQAVLAVLPEPPARRGRGRFPSLHDLTAVCCRFADDVEGMQRAEPEMADTIAAVSLTVAADMLLHGPKLAAVRGALRS